MHSLRCFGSDLVDNVRLGRRLDAYKGHAGSLARPALKQDRGTMQARSAVMFLINLL